MLKAKLGGKLYLDHGIFLEIKCYKKQVEDYYNELMNSDIGFEQLSEINNKITKKYESILEKNSNLKKTFNCELLGEKSQRLYNRMKQLDFINPYDSMFWQGKDKGLIEKLKEICGFYYYNMENLINSEAFYYYEMIKETRKLNKQEEYAYKFYSTLVDIFLEKTDGFVSEVSDYIKDEEFKILIKQQRIFEKNAGAD